MFGLRSGVHVPPRERDAPCPQIPCEFLGVLPPEEQRGPGDEDVAFPVLQAGVPVRPPAASGAPTRGISVNEARHSGFFRRRQRREVVGEEDSRLKGQPSLRHNQAAMEDNSLPQHVPEERGIDVLQVREDGSDLAVRPQLRDPRRHASAEGFRIVHVQDHEQVDVRVPARLASGGRTEKDHSLETRQGTEFLEEPVDEVAVLGGEEGGPNGASP